MLVKGLHY